MPERYCFYFKRYLVASRDLRPGELIISEDPLVVGPCYDCQPLCVGCYRRLDLAAQDFRCERCGWPLCAADCPGRGAEHGHSGRECEALAASDARRHLVEDLRAQYRALVPLRCLLLKAGAPDRWRALRGMESHDELRRAIPSIWSSNQSAVVDRIRRLWRVPGFDESEIHTVCGVLEVNCFEVGQGGVSIRALYPTAFYMAHDCVPNTNHTDDAGYRLYVRASTPIRKGEAITLSYAYTLQGTLKRREHLRDSKFFECRCARCSDPTELGTHAGALLCPRCLAEGCVLSSRPLDAAAPWRCARCHDYSVEAPAVGLLLDRIGEEAEAIDGNDVEALESFLLKYRNVLHANHYLFLGALHSLSQLYGKVDGYLIDQLPERLLLRKRDICRQLLGVCDVLEPGYTRLRGTILYELHAPLMVLLSRSPRFSPQQLKEVMRCLEEASVILGFEPLGSPEGDMGAAARQALAHLRKSAPDI
ncbi:SET domain-containing protein SmydA-8 isoform X2 [Bacillus rossius redtenbacheri]|uniref:SET domain-containing protein SmydA-8 isoform X2 n=1 Tax=Bacillus rossius redtenbacheri TaxID=93214 RepID=UPI002FDDE2B6